VRIGKVAKQGCPLCQDTLEQVNQLACPACEVSVVDLQDEQGIRRAQELGVTSVPAVAVDGKLAGCCQGRGPRKEMLVQAGLGQAIN